MTETNENKQKYVDDVDLLQDTIQNLQLALQEATDKNIAYEEQTKDLAIRLLILQEAHKKKLEEKDSEFEYLENANITLQNEIEELKKSKENDKKQFEFIEKMKKKEERMKEQLYHLTMEKNVPNHVEFDLVDEVEVFTVHCDEITDETIQLTLLEYDEEEGLFETMQINIQMNELRNKKELHKKGTIYGNEKRYQMKVVVCEESEMKNEMKESKENDNEIKNNNNNNEEEESSDVSSLSIVSSEESEEENNDNNQIGNQMNHIDIEIDLETIYCGGFKQITINNSVFSFAIQKGFQEETTFQIDDNTIGKIVYQQNSMYRRKGDDLIGTFIYDKQHRNALIQIPSLDPNQHLGTMNLIEGSFVIGEKGFYNESTNEYGNYIINISFQ